MNDTFASFLAPLPVFWHLCLFSGTFADSRALALSMKMKNKSARERDVVFTEVVVKSSKMCIYFGPKVSYI
jgi:hypothetical protein